MTKAKNKLSLFISIVFLLTLMSAPRPAYAQWPPFDFKLTSSYKNGAITYNIKFSRQVDWAMTDVIFKIPLPAGTRFLEASAQPTTSVDFDGVEITFFTSVLHRPIRNASFVVEVADPARTTFTTQAWIAWKGDQPGDYLTGDMSIDITRQPLDWTKPRSRLRLEASATVADDVVTYDIYPKHIGRRRMWDLKINVPVPEGTTFLSAEAPPSFATDFDGQEVSFSVVELQRRAEVGPLRFQVSTAGVTSPFVVTHAWATWKNADKRVGRSMVFQEETRTGDIVVQPHISQQVASDIIGDTPLSNYDVTSIALQEDGPALKITFYPVGDLGPVGEPLEYILYIDSDCRTDTGKQRGQRGAEYRVRYRHSKDEARFYFWDEEEESWSNSTLVEANVPAGEKTVTAWLPYDLLENSRKFCWIGRARNRTEAFHPNLSSDWIGSDLRLSQYEVGSAVTARPSTAPLVNEIKPGSITPVNDSEAAAPAPAATPLATGLSGKLAVPFNNDQGLYDVHIFSLPGGWEIANIPNGRQPNFRFDGQRLLVNREGGGGVETVFEYNLAADTEKQVSDMRQDSHPFYDPWGNRAVYGNAQLVIGADGSRRPFIFVQCGLLPPHQEAAQHCQDIPGFGVLVPAGQVGEIWGSHPVWTTNDSIAYKGCNSWAGFAACGIYIVPSASTKGFSDGFIPRQLTRNTTDIPSDTRGNLIAFTSRREGNWEAYIVDLNGSGLKNLSNSPNSNDGLPAISPDSNWVAFVSDRDGRWAVWAVPIAGGSTQKLFDLPAAIPWGDGSRAWTNERISWGP